MSEPTDELRAIAAQSVGLHPELTEYLRGETLAELSADAQRLRAVTIGADETAEPSAGSTTERVSAPGLASGPGLDGGTPRELPKPRVEQIRHLAKTDPRRFNEMLDRGELNLSELR